jgi:cell division protease FtsH
MFQEIIMKNRIQASLIVICLTLSGVAAYNIWLLETTPEKIIYSTFLKELEEQRYGAITLQGDQIRATTHSGKSFQTFTPDINTLLPLLLSSSIELTTVPPRTTFDRFVSMILFALVMSALWTIFSLKGEKSRAYRQTRFKQTNNADNTINFGDVAGIDEVREELIEIVDFLKNHNKYNLLGGRIPRGVLLQGPPGTGKTLLARALAGEALVPFYSLGGSDFVEMYAGVGASRVRELFGHAKKSAPCIVFIDEIDAIGGRRGGSNNHEEREQTLNALLVEMDGFSSHETVIVIGATNRPDILDPALQRPGRFDRQLTVSLPDLKGRIKILEVHMRAVTMSDNIELTMIARGTPGFSGADLANLVNEAALTAARKGKKSVETDDIEEARDKILMGLERKNTVINEKQRRIIACHEAGHAIVARLLPETEPLHKITIIPRGIALGITQQVPFEERYTYSLEYLLNRIKVLLGGRIAEEIIFNQFSTGAANDIAAVTEIAERLVCEWGMSPSLGVTACHRSQISSTNETGTAGLSEATSREIELEIRRVINNCYQETESLLKHHRRLIDELAEVLLINETIDAEELEIVVQCYMDKRSGKKTVEERTYEKE